MTKRSKKIATIKRSAGAALLAAMTWTGTAAHAQMPPSVSEPQGINLGGTSFFDGFSGMGPGWSYLGTLRYANVDAIKNSSGNNIAAFNNPKISVVTLLNQLAYTSSIRIGSASLSFNAVLPVVSLSGSFGQPGASLAGGGTAVGDLTVGPFLQFDPVMGPTGHPLYVQRLALDTIVPTGQYHRNADLNQSSGYYSLNPYWAASLFPAAGWEVSWRLHYLYNFKNTDPASSVPTAFQGGPVNNTQAGQAAWINFTTSYAVSHNLHVGINGYYFKQLGDDKVNGVSIAGSREQVLGIGPGMMLEIEGQQGKKDALWLNAYTETDVRNRPSSKYILQARYAHAF